MAAAAVDRVLERYLDTLDEYQTAHAALESHLKNAYFDLARAKLALGPTRVGQASYDLAQKVHSVAVTISSSQSSDANPEPPTTFTLSLGPSPVLPPSSIPSSNEPSSSTLRNRTSTSAPTPSSSSAPAATSADEKPPPPRLRDPIEQFSAFPPPALRTSQAAFAKAARAAIEVAEVKLRLEDIERRVTAAREKEKKSERVNAEDVVV